MKFIVLILVVFSLSLRAQQSYFVATNGKPTAKGTIKDPFPDLWTARDAIRNIKKNKNITIYVRKGTYKIDTTFLLNKEDSGNSKCRITYTNYKDERVILIGGTKITGNRIKKINNGSIYQRLPASVRNKVRQVDLEPLTETDYGSIEFWQYGLPNPKIPRGGLTIDNERLQLSRYPDTGFTKLGEIIDEGSIPRYNRGNHPTTVRANTKDLSRIRKWNKAGHKNIWMYGYFKEDYADGILQVDKLDAKKNIINLKQPSYYGAKEGNPIYYFNILEEITEPGEYYIDEKNHMLYFYPPGTISNNSTLSISTSKDLLIAIHGANYITFNGFDIEETRGSAISIKDGSNNQIRHCTIRNIEKNGILMYEGDFNNKIAYCNFDNIGLRPFDIAGGDKDALKKGNCEALHCRVTNFGVNGNGRINLRGIGNRIAHCDISQSNGDAIKFNGMEHIIEYNDIYDVDRTASDAGAIYTGRNVADFKNIIRYNYIHDIVDPGGTGVQGIYIDDKSSNVVCHGNIFKDVGNAAFKINGGRHCVFENNLIINTEIAAKIQKHAGAWINWVKSPAQQRNLKDINYSNSSFKSRYPKVSKTFVGAEPNMKTIKVKNNIVVNGTLIEGVVEGKYKDPNIDEHNNKVENNERITTVDDVKKLYKNATKKLPGFKLITFEDIGVKD